LIYDVFLFFLETAVSLMVGVGQTTVKIVWSLLQFVIVVLSKLKIQLASFTYVLLVDSSLISPCNRPCLWEVFHCNCIRHRSSCY